MTPKTRRMPRISQATVRELLDYNPDTGIFTWKERGRRWFTSERIWKSTNLKIFGKRAGTTSTNRFGYQFRQIKIHGKTFSEHELAWIWMTNDPLPEEIDHVNRDATDNRWVNLRASSRSLNSRNLSISSTNTTGIPGVVWDKARGMWKAQCKIGQKCKFLGRYEHIDEAAMASLEFRAEHGFCIDHGMLVSEFHRERCA